MSYRVKYCPEKGRHVVATQLIKPGQLLIKVSPMTHIDGGIKRFLDTNVLQKGSSRFPCFDIQCTIWRKKIYLIWFLCLFQQKYFVKQLQLNFF